MIKRTRKWHHMSQEAIRLAGLQMTPTQIGKHLGVARQTVVRWMAKGQVPDTRRWKVSRPPVALGTSAGEWAAAVRSSYALDATDEELVTMGEAALRLTRNPLEKASVQLNASRTFLAVVKALDLPGRLAPGVPEPEEKPEPNVALVRSMRRQGADPRTFLQAVK